MASRDIAFLKEAEARASRLISEARDERKLKLREAQAEVKREIEAYRAEREARLRTQQPEAAALDAKVARATGETDRCVVGGGDWRGGGTPTPAPAALFTLALLLHLLRDRNGRGSRAAAHSKEGQHWCLCEFSRS